MSLPGYFGPDISARISGGKKSIKRGIALLIDNTDSCDNVEG
jgi:hypothetical protein